MPIGGGVREEGGGLRQKMLKKLKNLHDTLNKEHECTPCDRKRTKLIKMVEK